MTRRDARQKQTQSGQRHDQTRTHWGMVGADPATASARALTPMEVCVEGNPINPPSWARRFGWLDENQANSVQAPSRIAWEVLH